MYEYELKIIGPKKSIYFYKDNVEIYKGEPSISANEDILLEEAYLTLQQSYSDIRANSKRKSVVTSTNITESKQVLILKGVLYEYKGYLSIDTIIVEIKYLGELIEEREFSKDFTTTIKGINYQGVEAAVKDVQYSINTFGTFSNGIKYPVDKIKINLSDSITSNIPDGSLDTFSNQIENTSFNSVNDIDFKKSQKEMKEKIENFQNLGLPPIQLIPKTIWEKIIEPKLLTKRQIIKKTVMITNKSLPTPVSEEDAQLIVYGKLYYKDGVLFDNDKEDPACVAMPGDPDYHKPIDENHPLWKDIEQKIEDIKSAFKQLGTKLGEFTFLIPHTIQTIAVSIVSMTSSIIVFPPGSGIPTAITAVQNIITAIKQLQAKAAEFLPIIEIISYLLLLLPKLAQNIISTILNLFKLIIGIITALTSIMSLLDIIIKLIERLRKKQKSIKMSVKAKANPDKIKKGETVILSAEATGGDYDYIYEWTDQEGNIISKDPNIPDDDGTREITPEISVSMKNIIIPKPPFASYTCKVTDQKGSGTSVTDTVNVYLNNF